VSRILTKLGARDRVQLVVLAYRRAWLTPDSHRTCGRCKGRSRVARPSPRMIARGLSFKTSDHVGRQIRWASACCGALPTKTERTRRLATGPATKGKQGFRVAKK